MTWSLIIVVILVIVSGFEGYLIYMLFWGNGIKHDLTLEISQRKLAEKELIEVMENQKRLFGNHCESERPLRKTICQKPKDHEGSCKAVIFWEDENAKRD